MGNKNTQKAQKTSFFFILAVVAACLSALFFVVPNVFGEDNSITDLEKEQKEQQEKIEKQVDELNEKIKAYKDIIKLKQKQGVTLASQIEMLEAQVSRLELEIEKNERDIAELENDQRQLEFRISEKERVLKEQRFVLSELLRTYQMDLSQAEFTIFVAENDGLYFSRQEWVAEVGNRLREVLQGIEDLKRQLVADHESLKRKIEENTNLKNDLEDRQESLALIKNQKEGLLEKTQGEEQKYQDLLARVEAQKKELLDFSSASNIDELIASVSGYPSPKKEDRASLTWYFSQRDPRWGSQRIGNSTSLMKDYGCAIASVSMVFRKFGSSIDPGKLAKQKIYYYDLINWPGSWTPGIKLVSSIAHGNVNWSTIDKRIKNGDPVIVYIRKTNGKGGHYVVITGKDSRDYIVHDPYFGPNLYLGTSRSLVGKLGSDSGTKIDQMIVYDN